MHLAEVIRMAQEHGAPVHDGTYVESKMVERRKTWRRRARIRAFVALAGIVTAAVFLGKRATKF
jgi:hypothetical protein